MEERRGEERIGPVTMTMTRPWPWRPGRSGYGNTRLARAYLTYLSCLSVRGREREGACVVGTVLGCTVEDLGRRVESGEACGEAR